MMINIYRGGITFMTALACAAVAYRMAPIDAGFAVLLLAGTGAFIAAAQEVE